MLSVVVSQVLEVELVAGDERAKQGCCDNKRNDTIKAPGRGLNNNGGVIVERRTILSVTRCQALRILLIF